jgi:hypothetical protein
MRSSERYYEIIEICRNEFKRKNISPIIAPKRTVYFFNIRITNHWLMINADVEIKKYYELPNSFINQYNIILIVYDKVTLFELLNLIQLRNTRCTIFIDQKLYHLCKLYDIDYHGVGFKLTFRSLSVEDCQYDIDHHISKAHSEDPEDYEELCKAKEGLKILK